MAPKNIVSREEFENFVEAVSGQFHARGWKNSAHFCVDFPIHPQLTCTLHVYLLTKQSDGFYFEPNKSDHTHVRVMKDGWAEINFFGVGARNSENWELVRDLVNSI